MRLWTASYVFLLLAPLTLWADTIELLDGTQLVGLIQSTTHDRLEFKTQSTADVPAPPTRSIAVRDPSPFADRSNI
jgi:hypothetical protein